MGGRPWGGSSKLADGFKGGGGHLERERGGSGWEDVSVVCGARRAPPSQRNRRPWTSVTPSRWWHQTVTRLSRWAMDTGGPAARTRGVTTKK